MYDYIHTGHMKTLRVHELWDSGFNEEVIGYTPFHRLHIKMKLTWNFWYENNAQRKHTDS